jgi:hypothetical protein
MGRFAGAFAISSFIAFAVPGAIGGAARGLLTGNDRLTVSLPVLIAALASDVYSTARKTWCPLTPRRQTPKAIISHYGAGRAAIAWGLDTGLVFTTFRVSSICWALLALEFLGIAPWWIGLGYAAGFVIPFVGACSAGLGWHDDDAGPAIALALARRPGIARMLCLAALTAAVSCYWLWLY